MKLLHVTHGYFPENTGGAESYARDLLAEQRSRGVDASLLTGSIEPWEQCGIEELEIGGTRVLRLHRDDFYFDYHAKAYHPGVERLVRDLLEREKPDLLHVHQWIRLTSNLLEIADDLGIPAVVTLHDLYTSCPRAFRVRPGDEACARPLSVESCLRCVPRYGHESDAEVAEGIELHRLQYQSELARARAVLVASPATAELISETTAVPPGTFTVLPLAYRRKFPDGAPEPAPIPAAGEPVRFAYWGSLTHRKGAQVLLRAFAEVVDAAPPRPAELHLFGNIDTDALRDELAGLASGRPVFIHGPYEYGQIAAVRPHMAVFPMLCFETFGFVLDEAFEQGLPGIVTDIGAMPRRAGGAALSVPPGDVDAMAGAMRAVLADPAQLEELRRAIPPLPPTPGEHAVALEEIYQGARQAPPKTGVPSVDPLRRASFLLTQRESALRHGQPGLEPR